MNARGLKKVDLTGLRDVEIGNTLQSSGGPSISPSPSRVPRTILLEPLVQ